MKRTAKENIDVLHRFASSILDSANNTIAHTKKYDHSRTIAEINKHMAEQILNLIQRDKLEEK